MNRAGNLFKLEVDPEGDSAYLILPTHPGQGVRGISRKQVDLMRDYGVGKDVGLVIDLDKDGEVIGIDIMMY